MIKIYDTDSKFISIIDICKDMRVTKSLEEGTQSLYFRLPLLEQYLNIVQEEYYVETADYRYIIKEVLLDESDFFSVYCSADLEDLKMNIIPTYDVIDKNIQMAIYDILDTIGNSWGLDYSSSLKDKVEYHLPQQTPYELIRQIQADYRLEVFFDTKAKRIKVYDKMGADRGVAFMNELYLKKLVRQGQSYDFATIVYPIGKDGLTIGTVNNGKNTISNFSYCNKHLTTYWINEDIKYPEQLKAAAEAYLATVSTPIVSYSVELSSLPPNLALGDTIVLIDKIKKIKQQQRVVKIIRYPYTPEKDKVELSNEIVDFTKTYTKFNSDYRKTIAYVKNNLKTLK